MSSDHYIVNTYPMFLHGRYLCVTHLHHMALNPDLIPLDWFFVLQKHMSPWRGNSQYFRSMNVHNLIIIDANVMLKLNAKRNPIFFEIWGSDFGDNLDILILVLHSLFSWNLVWFTFVIAYQTDLGFNIVRVEKHEVCKRLLYQH